MNIKLHKTLYNLYRVLFNVSNKVEQLDEISLKYAGQLVVKIHPKDFPMQLKQYGNDGQSLFDIDLHDHNEKEKDYTYGGIHIHIYKLEYNKKTKKYEYIRKPGRNLTKDEYEKYIKNININNLIQIKVNYE